MKNLLEYILIHLVDNPDAVSVEEEQTANGMYLYTMHVHPDDIGRVIGKGGSVIHSIRNIGKIRSIKEGVRSVIKLADGETESV
ncbi:KH domain-containing protein [Candidatus Woesebacteria bacterium]|nr:KH domain-containing protein [Candidatus Woesebacteria bacterium]